MPPYIPTPASARLLRILPSTIINSTTRSSRLSTSFKNIYPGYRKFSSPRTLPEFSLDGKCCIVSGASQGLGQEILTGFVLSGAHGAVLDLKYDGAQEAIEQMKIRAKESNLPEPKLHAYECDTSDETTVQKIFGEVAEEFGTIDIVVGNAGITGGSPAEAYDLKDWKRMMDININGSFIVAKTAGQYWIANKVKGNLIMVSSMSGSIVNRPQKQSAYNASKAAVAQMVKSMAAEWAPHGIRVNALSPGYIQTAANEGEEMEKLSKEWIRDIPMARIAKPSEFRGSVVYMASDASSYLTGSELIVDGGYTIW